MAAKKRRRPPLTESGRARARSAHARRVALDGGRQRGADVSHEDGRTTVALHAEPTGLTRGVDELRVQALVGGLASEIDALKHELIGGKVHFPRSGSALERLRGVLEAYGAVLQKDHARNVAYAIAELAWRLAEGTSTAKDVLAKAMKIRGEKTWETAHGEPVSTRALEAVRSKRGPTASAVIRAARAYRVLAWGASVDPGPLAVDGRTDRPNELRDFLEVVRAGMQLKAAGPRNTRNKGDL